MTNAPNPGNEPESNSGNEPTQASTRRLRRRYRRLGLALGVIFLAGLGGGTAFAWFFVQRQLAPLVERNVERLINRPLQLGEVESLTFNGLNFGAASIPA